RRFNVTLKMIIRGMMKIGLIAYDNNKEVIIMFNMAYNEVLAHHLLHATGTTGTKIEDATGLSIHKFQSGPTGEDQQIGALVATNEIDMIIFFRDTLIAQPHEPNVSALMRLCDVHHIQLATNIAADEIMINAI